MSLEEQIVDWSRSRPTWQRAVLREIAAGKIFSTGDYDALVAALVEGKEVGGGSFGLEHLPTSSNQDPPVRLVSVSDTQHVNALESEKPLTFQDLGLTIVYGDNGSGKSGYARLLKGVARARHQEPILSDVFHDSPLAKPEASLKVSVGHTEKVVSWTGARPPELKRMLFYDQACGTASIVTESDFPYRPSILFILDALIRACVAVRERIDSRLQASDLAAKPLPIADDEIRDTKIGRFFASISAESSLNDFDAIIDEKKTLSATIETLRAEEARLRATDPSVERQKLTRQSAKLQTLKSHLGAIRDSLGQEATRAFNDERGRLISIQEAADLLGKTFRSEPIAGVGSAAWKILWEAARRFSQADAYPGHEFPFVTETARCVLCQQPISNEARERLTQFERFVQDDTQTRLRQATEAWQRRVEILRNFRPASDEMETHLRDLEPEFPSLVESVRVLLEAAEAKRKETIGLLVEMRSLPVTEIDSSSIASALELHVARATEAAAALADPEGARRKLRSIVVARKELEFVKDVEGKRELIATEIRRLQNRVALEVVKDSAATGPITKKILELSEENITEVVRDTFTRETERLELERVTISKTRAERGALLHLPKLVGARQISTVPQVFSEGERSALGLAAFFTEAQLDSSKSALILDDPVTSLDHVRRALVATRLAALGETRQVVVFTHDTSFVADLKREAKGRGVAVFERSVVKGKGQERKPGMCGQSHPWKARDAGERLGDLRTQLARIARESPGWDASEYEDEIASWAGRLSETWERIFSQEIVGPILPEGGLEVRPMMTKIIVQFSAEDDREFQASYSRVSQWARRHDKSGTTNYVAPSVGVLEGELHIVEKWFKRIKGYKN